MTWGTDKPIASAPWSSPTEPSQGCCYRQGIPLLQESLLHTLLFQHSTNTETIQQICKAASLILNEQTELYPISFSSQSYHNFPGCLPKPARHLAAPLTRPACSLLRLPVPRTDLHCFAIALFLGWFLLGVEGGHFTFLPDVKQGFFSPGTARYETSMYSDTAGPKVQQKVVERYIVKKSVLYLYYSVFQRRQEKNLKD